MVAISNRQVTRRGKKFLLERASKIIENDKQALIIRGGKTNELIINVLSELYALKKPLAHHLKRQNPFHLFEDDLGVVKFSRKFDASLFLFGANSKKRPNSLTFGRMYDSQVLDMVELIITDYKPRSEFDVPGITFGVKPCILLQGALFDNDETMKRVSNLMVDWFKGANVPAVRLQGLELVISLTATATDELLFRVYRTQLKKSGTKTPRVELLELGPRINFKISRTKLASRELFSTAIRKPAELKAKPRKNTSTDVFGTKMVRLHVGRQEPDSIQTRKMKALKVRKVKFADSDAEGEGNGVNESGNADE